MRWTGRDGSATWGGGSAAWRTERDGFKGNSKGVTCRGKGMISGK